MHMYYTCTNVDNLLFVLKNRFLGKEKYKYFEYNILRQI